MSKERVIDVVREYMSVKEIAAEVGVSVRVVNYWLSGKRKPGKANLNQLRGLAKEKIGGNIEDREKIKEAEKLDAKREADLGEMEHVGKQKVKKGLRNEFLRIDLEVREAIKKGLYVALHRQNFGMWEKGKLIEVRVGGVPSTKVNWSELQRETGSDRQDLAEWYSIFVENSSKEQGEEWTKEKTDKEVEKWSKKVLPSVKKEALEKGKEEGKSEPHSEPTPREAALKCLAEHYDSRDNMWNQVEDCHKCPMLTLCRQLGEIIDKDPRFRDMK